MLTLFPMPTSIDLSPVNCMFCVRWKSAALIQKKCYGLIVKL